MTGVTRQTFPCEQKFPSERLSVVSGVKNAKRKMRKHWQGNFACAIMKIAGEEIRGVGENFA